MAKMKKMISSLLIIITILASIGNVSYATKVKDGNGNNIVDQNKKSNYIGCAEKKNESTTRPDYFFVFYNDEGELCYIPYTEVPQEGGPVLYKIDQKDEDYNDSIKDKIPDYPPRHVEEEANRLLEGKETESGGTWYPNLPGDHDSQGAYPTIAPTDDILDGIAGVLLLPTKMFIQLLGTAIEIILGFFDKDGVSVQKILFNEIQLTDINFFNFATDTQGDKLEDWVVTIRQNVAQWYVGIRNLSAVLLVIVALYVGIRMAISTVAEDKARYKQMLIDWITSLCMLFILHYIMIIIIQVNNTLVSTIGMVTKNGNTQDVAHTFLENSFGVQKFSEGMGNAVAFLMLEVMSFIFLLTYIKRMITIGFLIIIAPLVTVTYSIDKMGDGKSQAMNQWFKEFIYNILIQPFQCVTYLALCSTAIDLMHDTPDLKSATIAISMLVFLVTSEEIIKSIFNIRADSMAKTVAAAAIQAQIFRTVASSGKKLMDKKQSPDKVKVPKDEEEKGTGAAGSSSNLRAEQNRAAASNIEEQQQTAPSNAMPYGSGSQEGYGDSGYGDESTQGNGDKPGSKARKIGLGLAKAIIRANMGAAGILTGAALGGATGDFKAVVGGATMLHGITNQAGKDISDKLTTSHFQKETARAFNQYKKSRTDANGIEISDEQAAKDGMDLLTGKVQARTSEERAYRDALINMQNRYIDMGDDKKDSLKHTSKVLTGITDGDITEDSAVHRWYVNKRGAIAEQFMNQQESDSTGQTQPGQNQSQQQTRQTQPRPAQPIPTRQPQRPDDLDQSPEPRTTEGERKPDNNQSREEQNPYNPNNSENS